MIYIEVRTLAGLSYVRGADVLAVQYNDPQRCTIVMAGGVTLPCAEAAKEVVTRLETAVAKSASEPQTRS